ncbi:MAG: sigma-70 family RNA polymerase sigma factor [Oscillospiraceae bacterium]|nr:sigma-70 family RNA polymerase sigma factor [Oscillospiraceae bacterium]
MLDDAQIVALYWARSEDAIRETRDKYESYLLKIAYNVLSDSEESGECVNSTYFKAWNAMPPHRPQILRTFLARIARQTAIDRYRRMHAHRRQASQYTQSLSELSELLPGGETPEEKLDAKALGEALNRFLRTLPAKTRTLFLCRYFYFDSLKDAAQAAGMREAAAKSALFRARKALREYLEKEGFAL